MLNYTVNIDYASFQITPDRLKKLSPQAIGFLKDEYDSNVSWISGYSSTSFNSPTLRYFVRRFSEQLVLRPEQDLEDWFNYSSGRMINVIYADLYYLVTKDYVVNKSAAAAIGEAVAAYLMQKEFGYKPIARPLLYSPDIIMKRNSSIALVEAKASVKAEDSQMKSLVKETSLELLKLISTAKYDNPDYVGFVVATNIEEKDRFKSFVLELRN